MQGHVDNMTASVSTHSKVQSKFREVQRTILRAEILMMRKNRNGNAKLEKARTGIVGFDEVTNGGVPKGRPTIVCGGPGCGKTMFAVEFLVRGAMRYGEPGVLLTFEETAGEMTKNVASLGFDLKDLSARKK